MHRFLAVFSLLFLLPFSVRAASPAYVSEIAWAGSSASIADEWLEICGAPGTELSDWSIEGASANPITFASGTVIPASGAFLIANYADSDVKSTLGVTPDLVTTSVALSNSNLFVVLRDAGGAVIDAAGASGEAPFAGSSGESKASMERPDPATDGGAPSSWVTAATSIGFDSDATEFGTPGTCSVIVEAPPSAPVEPETPPATVEEPASPPIVVPEEPADSRGTSAPVEPMSALRISEIYPSPDSGEKEWVELVNPSNIGEILDGWTIEDAKGTKTSLEGILLPWARFVVESPKGSLNNDGDAVVLRDRFGRAVDQAEYAKIAKGSSVMRVELQDSFVVTETPTRGAANVFTMMEDTPPPPRVIPSEAEEPASAVSQPVILSAAKEPSPERDPSATLRSAQDDKKEKTVAVTKKTAAKPKVAVSKYKGDAYAATVVVPPGVYSKTRAYIMRDSGIEELRFSKSVTEAWNPGDRISFVAQAKSEGAVAFLLANPNSVRMTGSASATFATMEAWPEEPGGYRFVTEVASIHGNALEVTLGGVEGDVLAPVGSSSALKPGDLVEIEGFVSPGARPHVVLPHAQALKLFKALVTETTAASASKLKLPAPLAIGLTFVAGAVGLIAYLRAQRLKRMALMQSPVEEGAWE